MPRLTVDVARQLPFADLIEAVYGMLSEFEAPEGREETSGELEARISRTLDRCPDVVAWIWTLHAYFDHWTDGFKASEGAQSDNYKTYREKRDMCEHAASAAKLRYEGASRRITQLEAHREATSMRQGR